MALLHLALREGPRPVHGIRAVLQPESLVRRLGGDAEVDAGLQDDGVVLRNREPLPTGLMAEAKAGTMAAVARFRDQLEVGVGVARGSPSASHSRVMFTWRWH